MKQYLCVGGPLHTQNVEQDNNPPMSIQVEHENKTHVYRKHVVGHSDLSMSIIYVWEGLKVLRANSEQAKACRKEKENDNGLKESITGTVTHQTSASVHAEGPASAGKPRADEEAGNR